MKTRKLPLGDKNVVGANITRIRMEKNIKQKELLARLQSADLNLNPTSLSKIEGQTREVTDKELACFAKALGVEINELFN